MTTQHSQPWEARVLRLHRMDSTDQPQAKPSQLRIAAAADSYHLSLEEVRRSEPSEVVTSLQRSESSLQDLRTQCADLPVLQAAGIDLLIGHAEMTASLCRGFWTFHAKAKMDAQHGRVLRVLATIHAIVPADYSAAASAGTG